MSFHRRLWSISKVKIVQEIASELPIPPVVSYFLCDSWYTCGDIMDAFIQKGFYTISALKTNRILYPLRNEAEGQWVCPPCTEDRCRWHIWSHVLDVVKPCPSRTDMPIFIAISRKNGSVSSTSEEQGISILKKFWLWQHNPLCNFLYLLIYSYIQKVLPTDVSKTPVGRTPDTITLFRFQILCLCQPLLLLWHCRQITQR